jgi:hypothetical protein
MLKEPLAPNLWEMESRLGALACLCRRRASSNTTRMSSQRYRLRPVPELRADRQGCSPAREMLEGEVA